MGSIETLSREISCRHAAGATPRGNKKIRKAFLLSADRPRMTVGRQHKNTDTNPCQAVLRASQNQAPTLSVQGSPAAALNLSSGNAGSCCKGWYPCFCFVAILFYESAESVPMSLGPGTWGRENREPVQGFIASCLSKLHSGRNIRDMHDRWEQNPSMEFPDFLLHTFILHKPLIFTTSR